MIFRYKFLFALLLCTTVLIADEQKFFVRVLLDQNNLWQVSAKDEPLLITDIMTHKRMLAGAVRIFPEKGSACLVDADNRKIHTKAIRIQSKHGLLKLGSSWYRGSLYAIMEKNNLLLINNLDIEDYIVGVVRAEGFPGWPVEFNKVLAIASRSFVLSKIVNAEQAGRLYHVKNSTAHQTYFGHHEDENIRRAVWETRDKFLSFRNKPALAMYDICCGGVVPSRIAGVNATSTPYLARSYSCNHCKSSKSYRWQVTYPIEKFEKLMKKEVNSLAKVSEVRVAKKDRAGLVQRLEIKARSGNHYVSAKRLPSLTGTVKSRHFTVTHRGNNVTLSGKGYGHLMGMCEWGARTLVRRGWNCEEILDLYYPGTKLAILDRHSDVKKQISFRVI